MMHNKKGFVLFSIWSNNKKMKGGFARLNNLWFLLTTTEFRSIPL